MFKCNLDTGDIQKIESLFRYFSHQIKSISELNYWDRLSALKLYSQERRMERYRIIYVWKIIEGIAPNVGIETHMSTRHGRFCKISQINLGVTRTIRTIREGSFQIRGPQLFNSIPANLRGLIRCTVNTFKHKLDEYLKNIPYTPKIPGYTIQTDTNSHHIYAGFPGKLSNTAKAESPTWPERLLSNLELESLLPCLCCIISAA